MDEFLSKLHQDFSLSSEISQLNIEITVENVASDLVAKDS